jgi:microcystin-dependent protein
MACNNCYNGCAQIISDKCVKYTGVDIPSLGIENGDTLCTVEQALANYLVTALDGTGIIPTINVTICDLVDRYLPESGDISIVDIVSALIQAACNLQIQIDGIVEDIDTLNADYTIGCLEGVVASSDTHAVLQAVITKLCAVDSSLSTLINSTLPNNYVLLSDLDTLIHDYLEEQTPLNYYYLRMVPWVVYPYYGDINNFSAAGIGNDATVWKDIYLCNGANGTPDMRGRVPVGATNTPGQVAMNAAVVPGGMNPTYNFGDLKGSNGVIITQAQMPAHTHATGSSTAVQAAHYHYTFSNTKEAGTGSIVTAQTYPNVSASWSSDDSYEIEGSATAPTLGMTSTPAAPVITLNVVNASTGTGDAHSNYQPSIVLYYIIHIP